ncbi:hypothetical protein GIB67_029602 [Kingdonia uniflora]|uniref:Uncharacterized protein n=1 Tax=Kingdonia uniflora TaxID=39325 RepID=A0A7J7LLE5_9MAGN|nr:hypothetical protein GIB67_029602 [Kingdonia uniflora]
MLPRLSDIDTVSRKKLKQHKGKKFKDYKMLHGLMGNEVANGDNMRSVRHLIDEEDITDDLNDKSTPPVAHIANLTTNTSSDAPVTSNHTSTQTRRSTPIAKRQMTRPTAHVLDTSINVMTTELSCITLELVVRREFDWTMGAKVEAVLRGIIGFDMTYLFHYIRGDYEGETLLYLVPRHR